MINEEKVAMGAVKTQLSGETEKSQQMPAVVRGMPLALVPVLFSAQALS